MANTLYFGDNLHVLRQYVKDESVDLVYLDPPFNSKVSFNVLYKTPSGHRSRAQVHAFEDAWNWGDAAELAYSDILKSGTPAAGILRALRGFLGENDMMAYLAMMAVRLIELHRVLKGTGSLYLHCDPTASHYLKIILDGIFGSSRFESEIVWKRYGAHSNSKKYGAVHDIILFYTKGEIGTFNKQFTEYDEAYIKERFRFVDPDGRRWAEQNLGNPATRPNLIYNFTAKNGITYTPPRNGWKYTPGRMAALDAENRLHYPQKQEGRLRLKSYQDELQGVQLQDIWTDLVTIGGTSSERLGYPTQKPRALLERIISSSSNRGDTILDPFCGCGTAIHAALALDRRYIGIDITHVAIQIIQDRIRKHFPREAIEIIGRPADVDGAIALAEHDKYQFQWWATWLVGGQPRGGHKKGADRGVDGELFFKTGANRDGFAVISVKGGQYVTPAMVSELCAVREREGADIGIFICLKEPTREMRANAAAAGVVDDQYPRIQILTIEQLLAGHRPKLPPLYDTSMMSTTAKRRRLPAKVPSPEELRRQPQMPLPIPGGRTQQVSFALHEPEQDKYTASPAKRPKVS
ncbi:MAG TPA: site-specific DNA-methyltransferase [Aliidongia sp.]|nr:site-specific DNA-methyltransferase [Aliidongia sp.]